MEDVANELMDRNPDLYESYQDSFFHGKKKLVITLKIGNKKRKDAKKIDKDIFKDNENGEILILKYKADPCKKIQIFGKYFVNLNEQHCKISYKGKELK